MSEIKEPVFKQCNVNAAGCHRRYNMDIRKLNKVVLRYDACENENCQKKRGGIKGYYMPADFYKTPGAPRQ